MIRRSENTNLEGEGARNDSKNPTGIDEKMMQREVTTSNEQHPKWVRLT